MLTWLLLSTPVIAVAVIVWNHRRKAAAREAASDARLKEIFGGPRTPATDGDANASAVPALPPAAPATARREPVRPLAGYAVRDCLLTPPQTQLYALLKTHLSDCEVLAQVSAATVIDLPAGGGSLEREGRQRRLAAAVMDFLVCDKSFKALAVVQCGARAGSAAEALAFARACGESAGLRWVEVAPDRLPAGDTLRALVLDQ